MYSKIYAPILFMETMIEDTYNDKLMWDTYDSDYGLRHVAKYPVLGTKKYLKIEVFDSGNWSIIKTDYYDGKIKKVNFDNINAQNYKYRERILKLITVIKIKKNIIS
jgi:hypothetical protein